jgi:hypothetical protein
MFKKFLNKSQPQDDKSAQIREKVSRMNITEMRTYTNNKLKDFEICSEGLAEVMKRLIDEDESTSKRYIQDDDMDSKKKKAFDLVISVASSKKVTIEAVELIQDFTIVYASIIAKYDHDHKEIYSSRFKDALAKALVLVEKMNKFNHKRGVLGE